MPRKFLNSGVLIHNKPSNPKMTKKKSQKIQSTYILIQNTFLEANKSSFSREIQSNQEPVEF